MTTKLEVEKGQVRELERRLAEAVKVLPFVPAGEFKKAKAQLDQIKDAIGILRASADNLAIFSGLGFAVAQAPSLGVMRLQVLSAGAAMRMLRGPIPVQ
jgi:hypothetical protein